MTHCGKLLAMGVTPVLKGGRVTLQGLASLPATVNEEAVRYALENKPGLLDELRQRGEEWEASPTIPPLPMPWTPSEFEDRPCCWLPVPLPERMRGLELEDLQGFGIPAEGLPSTLRQFSRNGWRLRFDDGGDVEMVAGPGARREDGCGAYLDAMRGKVKAHLRQWEGTLCG